MQSQIATKANLSGATFTGAVVAPSISATTISGGTIYSGNTNLYSIFQTIGGGSGTPTYVQPGLNTYTAGTSSNPSVNISAATLNYLSANTISANTYYGDGSNLSGMTGIFGITIDGGNSVITTGQKGFLIAPYSMGITGWDIISNVSGSCILDVWKNSTIPTILDSITGFDYPTLSNKQIQSNISSLNNWNTGVTYGDIFSFNVISATSVSRITLYIRTIKK